MSDSVYLNEPKNYRIRNEMILDRFVDQLIDIVKLDHRDVEYEINQASLDKPSPILVFRWHYRKSATTMTNYTFHLTIIFGRESCDDYTDDIVGRLDYEEKMISSFARQYSEFKKIFNKSKNKPWKHEIIVSHGIF